MIHTTPRHDLALAHTCLTSTSLQPTATYHAHLDATIRLRAATGHSPAQIAHAFRAAGSFPLTASYVEARLANMSPGWLDAFTIDLFPEDMESAFGGGASCASLSLSSAASASEMQKGGGGRQAEAEGEEGRPKGWNAHVDAFASEIDDDDEGVRERVQAACGFEPAVGVEWVGRRLREIAGWSLGWVLRNGDGGASAELRGRIGGRMVVGEKVEQVGAGDGGGK